MIQKFRTKRELTSYTASLGGHRGATLEIIGSYAKFYLEHPFHLLRDIGFLESTSDEIDRYYIGPKQLELEF